MPFSYSYACYMHLSTRTYLNGLVIYPRVASFLAVQVGVGFVRMTGVYECACVASYVPYVIALARVVSNVRSLACMHARGNGGKYQKTQARERKELPADHVARTLSLPFFSFLRFSFSLCLLWCLLRFGS